MIPVYKVKWDDNEESGEKVTKPVISWSHSNWIAFSTGPTWHQQQRKQQQQQHLQRNIDTVFCS